MKFLIFGLILIILLFSGCVQCPTSCDDGDVCTYDFCTKETNYECAYKNKEPCLGNGICEEGEFYDKIECPRTNTKSSENLGTKKIENSNKTESAHQILTECISSNCKNLILEREIILEDIAESLLDINLSIDHNCSVFFDKWGQFSPNFNNIILKLSNFNLKIGDYKLEEEEEKLLSTDKAIEITKYYEDFYADKETECTNYYNDLIEEIGEMSEKIIEKVEGKEYGLLTINKYSEGCTKSEIAKLEEDISDLKDAVDLMMPYKKIFAIAYKIKCDREFCYSETPPTVKLEEDINDSLDIAEGCLKICNLE
jgi:hypothetical protein